MKYLVKYLLFWGGVAVGAALLYFIFKKILGVPAGSLLAIALVVTWILPRPWRFLLPLAALAELTAITPPLAMAAAIFSPLLIWWLRGRTEVDVSFSYALLVAASAALGLAILIGASTYPWWFHIPWLTVALTWLGSTVLALLGTILLPSIHSRLLHGRYF